MHNHKPILINAQLAKVLTTAKPTTNRNKAVLRNTAGLKKNKKQQR